jgi:hypothetical protein
MCNSVAPVSGGLDFVPHDVCACDADSLLLYDVSPNTGAIRRAYDYVENDVGELPFSSLSYFCPFSLGG